MRLSNDDRYAKGIAIDCHIGLCALVLRGFCLRFLTRALDAVNLWEIIPEQLRTQPQNDVRKLARLSELEASVIKFLVSS